MCEFESHSLQMSLFYYKGHGPFLYSYIAQMARAVDSYPTGRRFDSYCSYHFYGDVMVSTGMIKYRETSRRHALNPPNK